ncbi:universal stress protein [Mycobacterium shimoidei]|uniref:Universal stress protein family protein [Mycobacterium tuberculosis H37Rv] n=1 Tax=Mycobacterium shimoidei TaxID=29313 RepID=A0A1E3THX5_MYCSH|nr:universal stress protein [Mycobacterium shimoidei]MCV7257508.1 universal stress protein [Mycobacterium shimoidei]ODR13981.1 universal stress protein UspA [Mycobacterium shimoidei]ORW82550.1 universal stress protein UspA [Mycobacterium shimoidei]SRX94161.1 Universal stress protein family protein [Mycobacterium tuberculosis H37Rv] [Mycobacterium shimoidei]
MSGAQDRLEVLVGVDGSPASNCAVDFAAREAAMRNARLTIVHSVNPIGLTLPHGSIPASFSQWQVERAQTFVENAAEIARQAGPADRPIQIDSAVLFAPVVSTLVDMSKSAQLVVVGSRRRGRLVPALLGSVSSNLIRHAHCPVAVIHDEDPMMPHPDQAPVLVGIDGSPTSELATAIAFDEASRRGVELVALHVWSDVEVNDFPAIDWPAVKPEAERILAERLAGWQERYPDVAVRRLVECDHPTYHLVKQSESAQLVVVGSHGRGGFAGMLVGSVSNAVAHASRMPVIVARQP